VGAHGGRPGYGVGSRQGDPGAGVSGEAGLLAAGQTERRMLRHFASCSSLDIPPPSRMALPCSPPHAGGPLARERGAPRLPWAPPAPTSGALAAAQPESRRQHGGRGRREPVAQHKRAPFPAPHPGAAHAPGGLHEPRGILLRRAGPGPGPPPHVALRSELLRQPPQDGPHARTAQARHRGGRDGPGLRGTPKAETGGRRGSPLCSQYSWGVPSCTSEAGGPGSGNRSCSVQLRVQPAMSEAHPSPGVQPILRLAPGEGGAWTPGLGAPGCAPHHPTHHATRMLTQAHANYGIGVICRVWGDVL